MDRQRLIRLASACASPCNNGLACFYSPNVSAPSNCPMHLLFLQCKQMFLKTSLPLACIRLLFYLLTKAPVAVRVSMFYHRVLIPTLADQSLSLLTMEPPAFPLPNEPAPPTTSSPCSCYLSTDQTRQLWTQIQQVNP